MPIKLLLTPEVEQDISEAYNWYENRRTGLGEEFVSCLDACIETIKRTPAMYTIIYENYRRAIVRRFPYAIFYEYKMNTVIVYSIFHTSRDPGKWKERLL